MLRVDVVRKGKKLWWVACLAWCATPWWSAWAQDGEAAALLAGTVYVCDSSTDQVVCLRDLDGSGAIEDESETLVFYDASSAGPDLSVPSHLAAGEDGIVYLLDGGRLDSILALQDRNDDGDALDDGEWSVYYDNSGLGPALFTPKRMLRLADGTFYVCDDSSSAGRILHLVDINGDGDALDEGEARVVYDATALSVPVLQDIEAMAIDPNSGTLFVGETELQAVFALNDLDGDGDFLDAGELSMLFESSEIFSATDIDSLAVTADGVVLVADEDSGTILRLDDQNDDGDALDDGEVSTFIDETNAIDVDDVNDFALLADGTLVVLDGSEDTLYRVKDDNADGDAMDEGEIERWLLADVVSTPSGVLYVAGTPVVPSGGFIRGEVTGEGDVSLTDAVRVLGFLFLGAQIEVCLDAADADDSGEVNISDGVYVLNFLFLGGPEPSPPYPESGLDPTADEIDCPLEQ